MSSPADSTIAQQINREASRKNIPLSVLAELTHRCNLNCYFCYQQHCRSTDELSTGQWVGILDQLRDQGTLYLALTGGEPLIRSDFLDIVRAARDRGFALSLITNGMLVTPEVAAALGNMSIMDAGVSFHAADPVLHDRLTGSAGSHEKALRALRLLRDAGVRVLLKHTVSTANFGEFARLAETAEREGALFECDSIVTPDRRGEVSRWALSEEQQAEFLRRMGARPQARVDSLDHNSPLHCDAGRSLCGITPDGDVVVCIQLPIVLGNLRELSLEAIWQGEKAAGFRRDEAELDRECRECKLAGFCSRCAGIAFLESGAWQGASASLCTRARAVSGRSAGGIVDAKRAKGRGG